MADIKLPDLGEDVDVGDVVSIMVAVGDTVAVEQPLLELETGKATMEFPSPVAGTVEEILVSEGDKAGVGTLVMRISESGVPAEPAEEAAETPAATEDPAPPVEESAPADDAPEAEEETGPAEDLEFSIKDLGDGVESGDIMSILVAEGDTVAVEQPLLEVETGKATVEIPSTLAGTVVKILKEEGSKVKPGEPVFIISGSAPKKAAPKKAEPPAPRVASDAPAPVSKDPAPPAEHVFSKDDPRPAPAPMVETDTGKPVRAAPSVRKFAREIGIIINTVPPASPDGRITIEDVKHHAKQMLTAGPVPLVAAGAGTVAIPALPDFSKFGPVKEEKMSTIRRLTAQHMAMCWSTIPHVTQNDKADITSLEAWRKAKGNNVKIAGGKLTLTAILIRQVAEVLKAFPNFNASIDMAREKVIFKDYINIGIAVDTPKGLMVPVILDADKKSIMDLSLELTDIAVRAKDGKISPTELQGGTFTITNLGGIGGGHFTPIVNHPEVAILGIGRSMTEALYQDGEFTPRLMMPMSLSYDHRIIDGADGARFMVALKSAIEYPLSLTQLS